jgi:hypothetical protein
MFNVECLRQFHWTLNIKHCFLPLAATLLIQTPPTASLESHLRRLIESSGADVAVA